MQFLRKNEQKNVRRWAFFMAFAIWSMAVLGGLTRLTGSGLSIVEWDVLMGSFPPLHQDDWQRLFEKYQQTPQFLKVNSYFTLGDFKSIFWLEYLHRLWGRLLGVFFLLPWVYFMVKGRLNPRQGLLYLALFSGGLFQGYLGWYMVKSGLVDNPWVSPFRLSIHLLMATILMVGFIFMGSQGDQAHRLRRGTGPRDPLFTLTLVVLLITLWWGGLVAGTKAGLVYPTFPTMGGYWIPPELGMHGPWYHTILYNPVGIQFTHRVLAASTVILATLCVYRPYRGPYRQDQRDMLIVWFALVGQVVLGVAALLSGLSLPLAALHQGWGLAVMGFGVYTYLR